VQIAESQLQLFSTNIYTTSNCGWKTFILLILVLAIILPDSSKSPAHSRPVLRPTPARVNQSTTLSANTLLRFRSSAQSHPSLAKHLPQTTESCARRHNLWPATCESCFGLFNNISSHYLFYAIVSSSALSWQRSRQSAFQSTCLGERREPIRIRYVTISWMIRWLCFHDATTTLESHCCGWETHVYSARFNQAQDEQC
jgi:hypothetical protein